jgi:transcription antitermination factor NusG
LKYIHNMEKGAIQFRSNIFEKTLTFMDYENLDSTTNQVERTNRWFRKRQKTHYRNRKEENIVNMLKADLLGQMERDKDKPPVKLRPKSGSQVIIQVA